MSEKNFDFDAVYSRKNTNCAKWDAVPDLYKNNDLVPMWVADMDFKSPQAIIDTLTTISTSGFYGYPLQDLTETKGYVKAWLANENDWHIQNDDIFFIQSVVKGLYILMHSLTSVGDAILVHTPCYHPFEDVVINTKRKLIKSPLIENEAGYSYDYNDFEKQIIEQNIKATIICNPHNPVGRVWTKEELAKVIAICEKHNVLIISDDIHSDLIMPGYSYRPMTLVTPRYATNIVTLKSISKTFNVAGIHIGYFITTCPDYQKKINDYLTYQHDAFYPNVFAAQTLKAAYTDGKPWLEALCPYIYDNFQYLKEQLSAAVPNARLHNLEATYLCWLNVNYLNVSEEMLQNALDSAGVGIQTTTNFGLDQGLYIRINIACPRALMKQGVAALIDGLKKLEK